MKCGIIMPYYNEKELLVKSVLGILTQKFTNWHLYLVDDGSDRGKRAYEFLDVSTKNVTLVYKRNGGVCSARNMAIDLIQADDSITHVAYCDADDIWDDPYYLGTQISELSTRNVDMIYASPRHRFTDGSIAIPYGIPDYPNYPGIHTLVKGNFIYISGVVHIKKCLDVGYFDPFLNSIEDWDYWVRIASEGFKLQKSNATFTYTVKPEGGNGARSNADIYSKFYQKHSKYLNA